MEGAVVHDAGLALAITMIKDSLKPIKTPASWRSGSTRSMSPIVVALLPAGQQHFNVKPAIENLAHVVTRPRIIMGSPGTLGQDCRRAIYDALTT